MADARLTALRGLNEVFGQGGYSNLVLESLMRKNELTGQERAFCTALFYGVVERRITLDWVLGRYSRQPVEKLSPAVRDILRMAVYQLLYMPSIPERAAVNEAVKETRAMRVSSASFSISASAVVFWELTRIKSGAGLWQPSRMARVVSSP